MNESRRVCPKKKGKGDCVCVYDRNIANGSNAALVTSSPQPQKQKKKFFFSLRNGRGGDGEAIDSFPVRVAIFVIADLGGSVRCTCLCLTFVWVQSCGRSGAQHTAPRGTSYFYDSNQKAGLKAMDAKPFLQSHHITPPPG